MDRERVKGFAEKAKGDHQGRRWVSGDRKLQNEGKADKAKRSLHNVAGDVKDAARDGMDD